MTNIPLLTPCSESPSSSPSTSECYGHQNLITYTDAIAKRLRLAL